MDNGPLIFDIEHACLLRSHGQKLNGRKLGNEIVIELLIYKRNQYIEFEQSHTLLVL